MLYHGTDIDGPSFLPDQLNVREHNLVDLIRTSTYSESVYLLFKGAKPSPEQRDVLNAFLLLVPQLVPPAHPILQVTRITAISGTPISRAMSAGYLVECNGLFEEAWSQAGLSILEFTHEQEVALYYFALAPLLMICALDPACSDPGSKLRCGTAFIDSLYCAIAGTHATRPELVRILDAVMVAFIAGFGVVTPSIQVPRAAIGTGVAIPHAIVAGYATAGPSHAGACEEAMKFFQALLPYPDMQAAILASVDRTLTEGVVVFGFGHPLFDQDPRPPALRALCAELGILSRILECYDETVAVVEERIGIAPNIDCIAGAILLSLGFPPAAGTGLFLCSRTAAMVVHALERKAVKPAFGVRRRIARKLLMSTSKDDFNFSPF